MAKYIVDQNSKFQDAIEEALHSVDDLTEVFVQIASDFYRTQRPIFQRTGKGPYKDLSPIYKVRKKKAVGFVYPILKRNGFLAIAASIQGGKGNITRITPKTLEFGFDESVVPYGTYHQLGTSRLPRRPFMFIGPEERKFAEPDQLSRPDRWIAMINEFLVRKLKASGAGDVTK